MNTDPPSQTPVKPDAPAPKPSPFQVGTYEVTLEEIRHLVAPLFPALAIGGQEHNCKPTSDEIDRAFANKEFELRAFSSENQQQIIAEVEQIARKSGLKAGIDYYRLYHARRVAGLMYQGWTDPIEIKTNGTWQDGMHRFWAADRRGDTKILVKFNPA